MIKAILCDRDGVLINSEIVNIASSLYALADMGVATEKSDEWIIMGKHPKDYVANFVKKYHIDGADFLSRRKVIYKKMLFETTPFMDTVELLRELKKTGFQIGLVTSANRETTNSILHHFILDGIFDAIVAFEDCERRKPHPDPYIIGAELLHVTPAECIVLEDSQIGLRSAKAAGMICIMRQNEKTKYEDFSQADLVVRSLADAKEFIFALYKE